MEEDGEVNEDFDTVGVLYFELGILPDLCDAHFKKNVWHRRDRISNATLAITP